MAKKARYEVKLIAIKQHQNGELDWKRCENIKLIK